MLAVLRLPGAARAFAPSLVGRLALAMAVLAIVLAVQSNTGSFAAAGAASGAFGFANVFAAPWRARAIDRWGHRRALPPLAGAQAAGYFALAFTAQVPATPAAVFIVLGAATGVVAPPLGAAMRAAWTDLTPPGDQRTRALSLDAAGDEVVFVVGPLVAATLSAAFSPALALSAAAVALLLGTVGLTTSQVSRTMRGQSRTSHADRRPRALAQRGFVRVLAVLLGVGVVLGTIEVVAPAVAVANHDRAASGWLLAALSIGSAVGGLSYGHVRWRRTVGQRLLSAASAMGALTVGFAFVTVIPGFAVGAAAIGLFLAPAIVTGYLAADQLVPVRVATEASVWTNTALNLGAATANVGAGVVVAGVDTTVAMLLAGVVGVAAAFGTPRAALNTSPEQTTATQPD